jgi:hypothetical protein
MATVVTVLLTGRVMSTRNFSVGGIAGIHVIVSASVFRRPISVLTAGRLLFF